MFCKHLLTNLNSREIQWYFVTFRNDLVFSSNLKSSHVTWRHWSTKVLSLMGGSLFCTFFKKVEKSCPKCFKKRFKSRSRWRLILGLNPSFGGFFSKNFQKYISTITKIGGIILLLTGIAILTGQLQVLGFFILEYFPSLGNIG